MANIPTILHPGQSVTGDLYNENGQSLYEQEVSFIFGSDTLQEVSCVVGQAYTSPGGSTVVVNSIPSGPSDPTLPNITFTVALDTAIGTGGTVEVSLFKVTSYYNAFLVSSAPPLPPPPGPGPSPCAA